MKCVVIFKNIFLFLMRINIFLFITALYSQNDINYISRSIAYDFCKCINEKYTIDPDIAELSIQYYKLDKVQFNKEIIKNPPEKRTKIQETINFINQIKQIECKSVIEEYLNDPINVIDTDDLSIKYKDKILQYLSYNYNCQLSHFLFKSMLTL